MSTIKCIVYITTGSLIGCFTECSISGWFVHNISDCRWFPVFWWSWKSHQNTNSLQKRNQFCCFCFVLRKWMFCKWDVPIVPCVSFQNALFCGPHGLTFTWWGRCGLRFWYKPTELAHSFFSVLLSISCVFMTLSTVFHSINSPDYSPLSHCVLPVLFLPF